MISRVCLSSKAWAQVDERATGESLEKHISLLCSKPTAHGDSKRPNFDQKRLGFEYFQIQNVSNLCFQTNHMVIKKSSSTLSKYLILSSFMRTSNHSHLTWQKRQRKVQIIAKISYFWKFKINHLFGTCVNLYVSPSIFLSSNKIKIFCGFFLNANSLSKCS